MRWMYHTSYTILLITAVRVSFGRCQVRERRLLSVGISALCQYIKLGWRVFRWKKTFGLLDNVGAIGEYKLGSTAPLPVKYNRNIIIILNCHILTVGVGIIEFCSMRLCTYTYTGTRARAQKRFPSCVRVVVKRQLGENDDDTNIKESILNEPETSEGAHERTAHHVGSSNLCSCPPAPSGDGQRSRAST